MKKILLSLFVLSSVTLFAQSDDDEKPFHFGIGSALSLPLSDLKTSTSFGVGVEIQPSYLFAENIEGFMQAGVHVFKGNSDYGGDAICFTSPCLWVQGLRQTVFLREQALVMAFGPQMENR